MAITRPDVDHYAALRVPPGASQADIREAFTALIRKHRERPGEADPSRIERARQINMAYATLNDPVKRRAYDQSLGIVAPLPRSPAPPPRDNEFHPVAAATPFAFAKPVGAVNEASEPAATAPEPFVEEPVSDPALDHGSTDHEPPEGRVQPAAFTAEPPLALEEYDRADNSLGDGDDQEPRSERTRGWLAATGGAAVLAGAASLLLLRPASEPDRQAARSPEPRVASGSQASTATADAGENGPALPAPTAESEEQASLEGIVAPPSPLQPGLAARPPDETDAADPSASTTEPEAEDASPEPDGEEPVQTATAEPSPAPSPARSEPATSPRPQAPRRVTPARWVSGGLQNSDNPGGRFVGTVSVRFTVNPSGRVSGCTATRSSGNPGLDATTCNLLERRLIFEPAVDSEGRYVPAQVSASYSWGRRPRR